MCMQRWDIPLEYIWVKSRYIFVSSRWPFKLKMKQAGRGGGMELLDGNFNILLFKKESLINIPKKKTELDGTEIK